MSDLIGVLALCGLIPTVLISFALAIREMGKGHQAQKEVTE